MPRLRYFGGVRRFLLRDRAGGRVGAFGRGAVCAGDWRGEAVRFLLIIPERSISFLLGDGAGAAVVGVSDEPGIAPTVWGSDGSRWGTVGMTHSLLDIRNRDFVQNPVGEGEKIWPTLRQDGPSVFRWAVWEMAKVAQQALEAAGITADELGRLSRIRRMRVLSTRWRRP